MKVGVRPNIYLIARSSSVMADDGPQRIRVHVGHRAQSSTSESMSQSARASTAESGQDSSPLSNRLSRLWNRLSGVPLNSSSLAPSRSETYDTSVPPTGSHEHHLGDSDLEDEASSSASSSSVSLGSVGVSASTPIRDVSPWRLPSLPRWGQSKKGKEKAALDGSPRPRRTKNSVGVGLQFHLQGRGDDVDEGVSMVEEGGLGKLPEMYQPGRRQKG
jgi:hypothetical protein